jgi:hypothetical protein
MENRDGQSQLEGHSYSSLTNLVTSSIGVDWYVSGCNNALKVASWVATVSKNGLDSWIQAMVQFFNCDRVKSSNTAQAKPLGYSFSSMGCARIFMLWWRKHCSRKLIEFPSWSCLWGLQVEDVLCQWTFEPSYWITSTFPAITCRSRHTRHSSLLPMAQGFA